MADKDGIQKQLFNDSDVVFYHFLFPYSYLTHPLAVLFLVANNLLGKHVESGETQVKLQYKGLQENSPKEKQWIPSESEILESKITSLPV